MDIQHALFHLRTIRKFKDKKVPQDIMDKIFEAGLQAPSSCNQQMFHFIVIDDPSVKKRLETEATFRHIARIPNPIFVICDNRFNKENMAHLQGVSATIQNMLLCAYSQGIGGWWINGYGDRESVRTILNIPAHYHIVACVGFGYPDEKPVSPTKRSLDETVFFNRYAGQDCKGTCNPDHWNYRDIVRLSERAITAKSPEIGYFPLFPIEFENEVVYMTSVLKKRVLYLFDVAGLFIFELAKRCPDSEFTSVVTSQKLVEWFEERARFLGISNVSFIHKELFDIPTCSYDTVLLVDLLNRVPEAQRREFLHEGKRIMASGGNAVLYVINRLSIYGFLLRKGKGRRFGPEISLSLRSIERMIADEALHIVDRIGFALIPTLVNVKRKKIPLEFEKYAFIIKLLLKFRMLENVVTRFFRRFCRVNLFVVTKDN